MKRIALMLVIATAVATNVWPQAPDDCATLPSADAVVQSGFELSDTLTDLNTPASLGILASNLSGTGADKVAVKQWIASAPCVSQLSGRNSACV